VTEDLAQRERRIRQFEHYLGLMEHRTLRVMAADCFLIFSRRVPARLRPRIGAGERFVQFAFHAEDFYLDLPDSTLTHEEANRVVAERAGFQFLLADESQKPADHERQFDPIQRTYRYDEKRLAAEDTAYLFFDIWEIRLGAWLKVEAQAFAGGRRWERKFSLG
jgi:hypothetical protein